MKEVLVGPVLGKVFRINLRLQNHIFTTPQGEAEDNLHLIFGSPTRDREGGHIAGHRANCRWGGLHLFQSVSGQLKGDRLIGDVLSGGVSPSENNLIPRASRSRRRNGLGVADVPAHPFQRRFPLVQKGLLIHHHGISL